jgi:SHS2 domain-containing protein
MEIPGRQPGQALFKIVIEIQILLGNEAVIFRRYRLKEVIQNHRLSGLGWGKTLRDESKFFHEFSKIITFPKITVQNG